MKNTLLTCFMIVISASRLFAQSNTKQIGQFAWARSAQDSVNIEEIPFIENTFIKISDNGDAVFSVRQSYIILPGSDKGAQSKVEQAQPTDNLNDLYYIIRDARPAINDVIDVGHDIK